MRLLNSFLSLSALNTADAFLGGDETTASTLLAWQMLKNGGDMSAMGSINPLMMAELFGDNNDVSGDSEIQNMLLMHAFANPDMQQWLPYVIQSDKSMTDKLIMMSFLGKQESQGLSAMSEMMPLLMMDDQRHCKIADSTGSKMPCTCTESKSDTILKIMLMTGNGFMQNSAQANLFYMLFNDNEDCTCTFDHDKAQTGTCTNDSMSGMDPLMMYMMMNSPMRQMDTPEYAPRSAGLNQFILSQTMGLSQDYQWLMEIEDTNQRRELAKENMMMMMGVPTAIINMLDKKRKKEQLTPGDKFAMLNYITGGVSDMPAEVTAMFIGAKDAKKFYISSALSSGQVPELAGMLMMALEEGAPIKDIKDVLVQVATGRFKPEEYSIIGAPYVPELPVGVYPGQDLYFIHIHMLQSNNEQMEYIDTCAMHDLRNRFPCQRKQYGGRGPLNAEQCHSSPTCCWNPIQITDEQANALAGKDYKDIPWCYYNIFFVYHDTYYVKVARPVQVASKFIKNKYQEDGNAPGQYFILDGEGNKTAPMSVVLSAAQEKERLKSEQEIDRHNTAFATPAQCPGLFKYGLELNPIIYARAMSLADGALVDGADTKNDAINQLIHKRTDCGFPGIPKFQCVAIRGCCWDETVYDPSVKIPQCYKPIDLIPPSIFKIVDAPADLRPAAGDCNSNFFRLPQLYYEREACNYDIDMFKYDGTSEGLTVLDMPNAEDCMLKLGCCWEEDQEVLSKYPWLPRCYKRQRNAIGEAETDPIGLDASDLVARSANF